MIEITFKKTVLDNPIFLKFSFCMELCLLCTDFSCICEDFISVELQEAIQALRPILLIFCIQLPITIYYRKLIRKNYFLYISSKVFSSLFFHSIHPLVEPPSTKSLAPLGVLNSRETFRIYTPFLSAIISPSLNNFSL